MGMAQHTNQCAHWDQMLNPSAVAWEDIGHDTALLAVHIWKAALSCSTIGYLLCPSVRLWMSTQLSGVRRTKVESPQVSNARVKSYIKGTQTEAKAMSIQVGLLHDVPMPPSPTAIVCTTVVNCYVWSYTYHYLYMKGKKSKNARPKWWEGAFTVWCSDMVAGGTRLLIYRSWSQPRGIHVIGASQMGKL